MCLFIYIYVYIYLYIRTYASGERGEEGEREREREGERERAKTDHMKVCATAVFMIRIRSFNRCLKAAAGRRGKSKGRDAVGDRLAFRWILIPSEALEENVSSVQLELVHFDSRTCTQQARKLRTFRKA